MESTILPQPNFRHEMVSSFWAPLMTVKVAIYTDVVGVAEISSLMADRSRQHRNLPTCQTSERP